MNDATTPIGEGKVTVGGRLSKCSSPSFASQAQSQIPAELGLPLAPLLEMIAAMGA